MQDLQSFLTPGDFISSLESSTFEPMQWGAPLSRDAGTPAAWEDADIVLIGCGERRGESEERSFSDGPDQIRKELYAMYNWHPRMKFGDAGNIIRGVSAGDTRAALRTVLHELEMAGKTVIVIGGSHDLTMQQYEAFRLAEKGIHASVADMLIDLDETERISDRSFLLEMLTSNPNFVRHYSHIGFQSYYVHPQMLETLDKLRFDFVRLGKIREHMEEAEPALRGSDMFSFDINAIRYSDAPGNPNASPNGFTGEEACMLTRYAGMSERLSSLGIYGYNPEDDLKGLNARLISQMIWYFIDGYHVRVKEAPLGDGEAYQSFYVHFTGNDTLFLKSKRTGRWWMQLPDNTYEPCSYQDYLTASRDEIPERWLRAQERLV